MQITAAIARQPHADFSVETVDLEAPRADEVLVRITGVGLCHTDLITRDGFIPVALPAVLGHEGAGIVEAVGADVTKVAPGDRVVLSFASCGYCSRCNDHLPSYCREFPALNYAGARKDGSTGISIGGERVSANFFGQSSFATHALAFERNVVKIEDPDAPLEILGPMGCGFQTGAGGIMRALACPAGSTLAIFGGGPVGLSAVMGAVIQGCGTIIMVEPIKARRDLALELGATHVIDPAAGDMAAAIRTLLPDGVDYAFETSGREAVVEAGLASLASHGVLGLVGVPPKPESSVAVNLAGLITYGHRIQGIIEGDSDLDGFIPQLVALHREGRFPIEKLTRTWPLSEINAAVEAQHKGECVKAVLIP